MAILDRVKERTETDLTDAEIQFMIDEVNQEIISRYGPHSDPAKPVVELLAGNREVLVPSRAIDISQTVAIVEYYDSGYGETTYVCQSTDYRIWPPHNVSIERRFDGVSNRPRRNWADRVQVTYVPVNDGNQREEVIIKLVIIAIQYDAFSQQTVGDVSGQTGDYIKERQRLMDSISPRHGLGMA